MSDPTNKDHLPAVPEFQPEEGLKESPPWRAVGLVFWIVLGVSVLGGFTGAGGVVLILLACAAGALFVCGFTIQQLFDRRFGAALATLVVGLISVAAAGFVGAFVYFQFSFEGFW